MPRKNQFVSHLKGHHPTLENVGWDQLVSENLLSPYKVQLPKSVLSQAQDFVRAAFALRENANYIKSYASELERLQIKDPGNKSICMSYDFHLDQNGVLKLIEINTNAAFLILGYEMYKARSLPIPVLDFKMEELKENILTELKLQGKDFSQGKTLTATIIDEKPQEQRLFIEFLVAQSYFRQWGWNCQIENFDSVSANPDFIYNRFTDFFLGRPESKKLREEFLNRKVCLSPNPFEYFLLADKERMLDWNENQKWSSGNWPTEHRDIIQKHLPKTKTLSKQTGEEIWTDRKKYFLKPKQSFGSKQSYRGGTVSRRNFEEILEQDFLAQEYIPAPEVSFGAEIMKYDLRFYAYQDRVQMAVARLYQGQVTNLRTPNGGFTPIEFKD